MNVDNDGGDEVGFDEEDITQWKEPQYIKFTKKLKTHGVLFGMDVSRCVSTTASICSDKAANFWGQDEGFEGHRVEHETEVMAEMDKEVRTIRNHCVNHLIDLESDKKGTDAKLVEDVENFGPINID